MSDEKSLENNSALSAADYWLIYIAVIAATLPAVLPVIVSIFADNLGFGTGHAGYIASANMTAILAGVMACYLLIKHFTPRQLLLAGLTVMVCGHLLTMAGHTFAYILLTRIFSGLGEGVVSSVCYRAMGMSSQPARAVALYAAGQAIIGAIGMGAFNHIQQTMGWQVIFLALSVIAIPAFWAACRYSPNSTLEEQISPARNKTQKKPNVWIALGGTFIFFAGLGGLFAFSAVIGKTQGISTAIVSSALATSSLSGLGGSMAATVMARRLPQISALAVGTLLLCAAIIGLFAVNTAIGYSVSVCLMMFAWYWTYPFQFEILSGLDKSGRALALVPAITGGGLALGPLATGLIMPFGTTYIAFFSLAAVTLSLVIYMTAGRRIYTVHATP